jgi:hypothetical protein
MTLLEQFIGELNSLDKAYFTDKSITYFEYSYAKHELEKKYLELEKVK